MSILTNNKLYYVCHVGENVKMDTSQVSHDYSSDSGLLHIYIEGVLLDDSFSR